MKPVDPYTPSFAAAVYWAKETAFLAMRADGRDAPSHADRLAGNAVLVRLLWLVEGPEGGFIGADNAKIKLIAKRLGLTFEQVATAMWAPGEWPKRAAQMQVAA